MTILKSNRESSLRDTDVVFGGAVVFHGHSDRAVGDAVECFSGVDHDKYSEFCLVTVVVCYIFENHSEAVVGAEILAKPGLGRVETLELLGVPLNAGLIHLFHYFPHNGGKRDGAHILGVCQGFTGLWDGCNGVTHDVFDSSES